MSYAEALKSLRHAYKLTQTEFANLLQVSKPSIQKLEAGDYPPSDKMIARVAELFRTDKFKKELLPRIVSGDLRSVRIAFGDLLESLDDEGLSMFSSFETSDMTQKIKVADAYADLKRIQEIVMAQQDTIRELSLSIKKFADSNKIMAESSRALTESNTRLSVSIKKISEGRA